MPRETIMENSANTKLVINLMEGIVEVEGTEDFVRFIYQDFKENLSKQVIIRPAASLPLQREPEQRLLAKEDKELPKKTAEVPRKPAASGEKKKSGSGAYKPTFNSKINLTGVETFYDELKPENNSECIVVFAAFLRDRVQMSKCSANDLFTCFFTLKSKTKIPTDMPQAIKNAKHRTHFIEYETIESIEITSAGDNWLEAQAKKVKEQPK
jgi:hypothetical protein